MPNLTSPEVRYQMLRPAQVVARREACPIAYLPLGNLEWHGVQNPLGADTLQAEGAAIRAAQKDGGLVLPPLWYFAPVHEMTGWIEPNRDAIAEQMQLPVAAYLPETDGERIRVLNEQYQRQLVDLLIFAETLGFKVCVLIAGHYPLIAHAVIAAQQYQTARNFTPAHPNGNMIAWACQEPALMYLAGGVTGVGDHGGRWETANCMALYLETVDLAVLPANGEAPLGISNNGPQDATPAQGWEHLEAFSELVSKEAHSRLKHPDWYSSVPYSTAVGLWKDEE